MRATQHSFTIRKFWTLLNARVYKAQQQCGTIAEQISSPWLITCCVLLLLAIVVYVY